MSQRDIADDVRRHLGLRIEREMARYLSGRLSESAASGARVPLIGSDARTGVPRRQFIDPQVFGKEFP